MKWNALVLGLALVACNAPAGPLDLESMYRRSLKGAFAPDSRVERLDDVRQALANPEISARERVFGALLLLDSAEVGDMELAHVTAERALDAGLEEARPVMAQAIDRALYLQGYPQKYGTQYHRDEAGTWQLYPVDQNTRDDERRAMGVPTLAEALARVRELQSGR